MVVGLPLGVLTAIYLAEYANPRVRGVLTPTLEILAGIPTAVTIAAGNTPKMTFDFFTSIQTLTASIAQTVRGEVAAGTVRYNALFALG